MTMPGDAAVLADRYRLEHVLARAEASVVWVARDETLGSRVAVKEVHFASDIPSEETKVLREFVIHDAQVIKELDHPGIVKVQDFFAEEDRCYVVTALVDGRSLAEEIDSIGPLSPKRVAAIGIHLLDVLIATHEAGVVHGDIKPSKVLFAADGRVLLTDFSIAVNQAVGRSRAVGQLVGSPAYMSPERLRGWSSGPPSDIWSLAATLYAALEAQPPFRSSTTSGTIAAVLNLDVPLPHVRGALREALLGMLQKAPEARLTAAQIRPLLTEAANQPEEISPEAATATVLVPASVMAPAFRWTDIDEEPVRARWRSRPLLTAIGAALIAALAFAAVQFGNWGLGADQKTAGLGANGRERRLVPEPFQSRALFRFSRGLFDPAECRTPNPGEFRFVEMFPDIETVVCEAAGREAKVFRKATPEELRAERRLHANGAIDGSVQPIDGAPSGPPALSDGRQVSFVLASDGRARVYWDSVSCACGGVIIGRGEDVAATIDFWRGG